MLDARIRHHSLRAYETKAMRAVFFAFVVVPVIVFPVAIVAQAVLDLNFIELAEAVQASKKSTCCYSSIDNKALQQW